MSTPQDKGNLLEIAVHAIENAIVRNSPSYHEKTFRIEMKKVVTVADVRHEIDIWVEVDLGEGYKALFIFECKNWVAKVGKNEIIVFSEKIQAVQAQRGFFVAKSFTTGAKAQAAKDPRITLLLAADLPATDILVPFGFHAISVEGTTAEVAFVMAGADEKSRRENVDPTTAQFVISDELIAANKYLNDWVSAERDRRVRTFNSVKAQEGVNALAFEAERRFEPHTAALNGKEVARITIRGEIRVRVVRPKIISHFQVATRGRALTVGLDISGKPINVSFVALPSSPKTL